ncbi:MAG: protein translocase subunit SecDF [Chitinophagaceae bacterium]|jgi:SecD/SecF fusion protein
MQLKGLVKFFTVALILISLYQLSFTFIVKNVETKAQAAARNYVMSRQPELSGNPDEQKKAIDARFDQITDSMQGETVFNALIKKYTYQEAKDQEINLGLDLQGGMNVTLEVGLDGLVRSMSNNPKDPALNKAIADANALKANSDADFIKLFGEAYQKNSGANLASLFTKPSEKDITLSSTNAQVLSKIRTEADAAIDRTYNVIQTRIDKFGVANPNVNLDKNKGIISVELAGVRNPERVRTFLQSTARLQFWSVAVPDKAFSDGLLKADEALAAYLSGAAVIEDTTAASTDSNKLAAEVTADTNKVAATDVKDTASLSSLMNEKDGTKVANDTSSLAGGSKANKNPLLSLLAGSSQGNPAFAFIEKKNVKKFMEYLELDVVKSKLPNNIRILLEAENSKNKFNPNAPLGIYAIKLVPGKDGAMLEGDQIVDAGRDYDQMNGKPEVTMTFNSTGERLFKRLTGENVGGFIAIVMDDRVYSAPSVAQEISGGRCSISGSFTIDEATDLANILKSGKLSAPARIVQEQVVGPTLGAESIAAGKFSLILSFIVIFALMLIYYNTGGIVANIALILNIFFTIAILASAHATLTMASIAGLVLTIGMAVDTNVIVFERIKEELSLGKSYKQAIDDGYKRSYAPVLDGHISQFITAVILFIFGLGPVRGFAYTQMWGLFLSVFCGLLVSRLITDIWMKRERHFNYFTKISTSIFRKAHFKFIEARKYTYMISGVIFLLGIASIFHGFNYGVEFSGGRSYTVKFAEKHTVTEVKDKLEKHLNNEFPIVKTIGTKGNLNITTAYMIDKQGEAVSTEVRTKLYDGLKAENLIPATTTYQDFADNYIEEEKTVLPTISDDLKKGAVKATIFAVLAIFLYILIRFRKWQYSLGTIISLMHDVCVTFAVFSFFKDITPFALEIDQHFIAAILTVIGFSMNDTVIVFDRVREYFRKNPGEGKVSVINRAINDTLSRTVMTSLTVFLTVLILFIFGGEATRGFAFAMLIGVVTGTYSSIFVAAPVLVDLDKKDSLAQEVDREAMVAALKSEA